jgi:hypothetical protein
MFENAKVGDNLYLHVYHVRFNEKPIKKLVINKIGRKYIFCGEHGSCSEYNDYKIDINTGENISNMGGTAFAYNSAEEIKNKVILEKMVTFADEWMGKIDDEDKYKLYLQFKDIIDNYINIDEINKKYSL